MRIKSSMIVVSVVTALALSGCTGTDTKVDGSAAPAPQSGAALTIAKPDGAIATESNNPWVGDSSGLKLGYINEILEPLAMVNTIDPSAPVIPWLASDITWADDYKSVVVTARDGVKWSDGQDFTADDIAFSYQMYIDHPELDTAALGLKSVEQSDTKVTLTFENSMYVKTDKVLMRFIVPKHIWENSADPATDTNMEPVGTGPYVLSQFTTQSVTLTARDDYWGGALAVPTLYFVSYNDNTALTTALANGDADWAQAFIPNVDSAFISKDADHNVYWPAAGLGIDAMFVNTTTKPFNDVAFRKAVNMVLDRKQHQAIAREGGVPELTSITGLPTPVGDSFILDEFKGKNYTIDVDGARKVLEDAGYTWNGDQLVDPSGEDVSFTIQVPQGWSDYVTGISLIADEVKPLGVTPQVNTPDSDTWWADKSNGNFQAILHWTDSGLTPWDLYSDIMDGRWLMPVGESADHNFGRYDNPEATTALAAYANATSDSDRSAALATIQKIFVEDVPAMPIGTRPSIAEYNTRNYVGWPSADDPYINPDPTQPTATYILTQLKPAS